MVLDNSTLYHHVQVESVQEFVTDLEHPDFLIKGCRIFQEIEHRDIVYIVVRRYLDAYNSKQDFVIAAKMFLLVWNDVVFRMNPALKDDLEEELSSTYDAIFGKIGKLDDMKIETDNISQVNDIVCELFNDLYIKNSIGQVGASKVLHLLKPDFFVMWDNSIMRNYHTLHKLSENKHFEYRKDLCYLAFLHNCNTVAQAISAKADYLDFKHNIHHIVNMVLEKR